VKSTIDTDYRGIDASGRQALELMKSANTGDSHSRETTQSRQQDFGDIGAGAPPHPKHAPTGSFEIQNA
jgi:hypothetical protein